MGLDMYLYKDIYVGAYYEHRKVTGSVELFTDDRKLDIDVSKIHSVREQVAYWRKANAIHNWFVKNLQEGEDKCQETYVSEEDMEELLNDVNLVLNSITLKEGLVSDGSSYKNGKEVPEFVTGKIVVDSTIAKEILPTKSGFFFGGTDYDEWYVKKLQYTKEVLESILNNKNNDYVDYYYKASW